MFSIRIQLDDFASLSGLDALDTRRRLMLTDMTALFPKKANVREFPVDEGFARLWFGRQQTQMWATVELDWLTASDVEEEGQCVRLTEQMTVERAKELFVRYQFEKVKDELDDALADLQSLKAESEAVA